MPEPVETAGAWHREVRSVRAAQPSLGQGMVALVHPRLGELSLFMTPIGRDAQGMRYEIVFN